MGRFLQQLLWSSFIIKWLRHNRIVLWKETLLEGKNLSVYNECDKQSKQHKSEHGLNQDFQTSQVLGKSSVNMRKFEFYNNFSEIITSKLSYSLSLEIWCQWHQNRKLKISAIRSVRPCNCQQKIAVLTLNCFIFSPQPEKMGLTMFQTSADYESFCQKFASTMLWIMLQSFSNIFHELDTRQQNQSKTS